MDTPKLVKHGAGHGITLVEEDATTAGHTWPCGPINRLGPQARRLVFKFDSGNAMRVLIADDHDLVREVIAAFLVSEGGCEVDAVAWLDLALEAVRQGGAYDLALLDYNMPGMNGLEGINAGAAGFLSKALGSKAMAEAVRLMLAGQIYAPTAFAKQGRNRIHPALSPRETDVLKGICAGKSNKEIARDHDLQEVTVKLHVKTMRHKLGARNRTHAATIAKEQGLA